MVVDSFAQEVASEVVYYSDLSEVDCFQEVGS